MRIRSFQESDMNQVVTLFYETVHSVNAQDYSTEQLNAWAPKEAIAANLINWKGSLETNITYIAEIKAKVVGFSDMTRSGYLDRIYIHKDFQGQGIATALINRIEWKARKIGLLKIDTEASLTARSFFEHRGYQLIKSQHVNRKGIILHNFQMTKWLISE